MASATIVGYLIITETSTYSDEISSPWAPLIAMLLVTYTVGGLFM